MATPDELNRFAELIWRTIKLRVSLLIVTTLILLIIWSGVLAGDIKALVVDKTFCSQLVNDQNRQQKATADKLGFVGPQPSMNPDTFCTEQSSRTYVEGARAANQILATATSGDNPNQELIDLYRNNISKFATYDAARRDAYALQVQLSSTYSSSAITVNMLSVAEIAPYIALLILSAVAVLGFQQKHYKSDLAKLSAEAKGDHPESALAQGQFFVRPQLTGVQNLFVLSPEKLAVWALSVAVVVCLVGLLSAFVVNVIHLTDVIYGNYLSGFFSTSLLAASCLWVTRKAYAISPVVAARNVRRNVRNWTEFALIGLGLLSLVLPWTLRRGIFPVLRGFQFIVIQTPLSQIGPVTQYPIEPHLYTQIRPQVDLALLFLAVCALQRLGSCYGWAWRRWLNRLRAVLAFVVFYLSLNFLLYMLVLEYEAETGKSWDFSNMISAAMNSGGSDYAIGLPMSIYDPSYGFILFMASCFALIWLSLGRYADPP